MVILYSVLAVVWGLPIAVLSATSIDCGFSLRGLPIRANCLGALRATRLHQRAITAKLIAHRTARSNHRFFMDAKLLDLRSPNRLKPRDDSRRGTWTLRGPVSRG